MVRFQMTFYVELPGFKFVSLERRQASFGLFQN